MGVDEHTVALLPGAVIDSTLLKSHKRLSKRTQDSLNGRRTVPDSPPQEPATLDELPDMNARSSVRSRGPKAVPLLDDPFLFGQSQASMKRRRDDGQRRSAGTPLTPPLPVDTDKTVGSGSSRTNAPSELSYLATPPVLAYSPPTPDTTPSRSQIFKAHSPALQSKGSVSSNAESFRTAHSKLTSMTGERTPSVPAVSEVNRREKSDMSTRSGLGLAYVQHIPGAFPQAKDQFASFDSFWGGNGTGHEFYHVVKEAHNGDSEDSETLTRKRRRGDYRLSAPPVDSAVSVTQPYESPTLTETRDSSLTSGGMSDNTVRSAYTGRADTSNQQMWREGRVTDSEMSDGRSSVLSVVPAYVIEPEPVKRRTLRHSRAQDSLRKPVMSIATRYSLSSEDEITPRRISQSYTAQSRLSGSSYQSVESVRRDSDMQRLSASTADSSVPQAKNSPITAASLTAASLRSLLPDGDVFGGPAAGLPEPRLHRRSRSFTEEEEQRQSVDMADYPIIPQRRSSLSAPTSRNNSRSQSFSSAHKHHATFDPTAPRTFAWQTPTQTPTAQTKERSPSLGPRRATTTTLTTAASMTPEVSEATAMGLFPHTNKSVVMVEQGLHQSSSRATSLKGAAPVRTTIQRASTMPVQSPLRNPREAPRPPPIRRTSTGLSLSQRRPGGQLDGAVYALKRTFSGRGSIPVPPPAPKRAPTLVDHSAQTDISAKTQDDGFQRPILLKRTTRLHPFWQPRAYWSGVEGREDAEAEIASGVRTKKQPVKLQLTLAEKLGLRPLKQVIYHAPSDDSLRSHRPFTTLFFKPRAPSPSELSYASEESAAPVPVVKQAKENLPTEDDNAAPSPVVKPVVQSPKGKEVDRTEPPMLLIHPPTEPEGNDLRRNPTTTTIEAVNATGKAPPKRRLSLLGRNYEIHFVGISGMRDHLRERRAEKQREGQEKRRESLKKQIGEMKVLDGGQVF